ncbi:T9SS C-terminal target domain-containing protein [Flavobacterium circumlabens]|uniref:Secreted protein (Por secretion system target) n=1 Tax=Flavobacterium circumlabens TaxID=2133765 RepID=A0A4Y7U973_9FLAO|nr:family 16 glycosylhydrolase [Flavobacterium circumlabens]TCN54629.1 putative secreted protein (Por secretion system target) [Flavobacterium circumlabens]TEB42824.1 T9SS C-terminal target domain-containing protein [Flavobacterium circumlabens]
MNQKDSFFGRPPKSNYNDLKRFFIMTMIVLSPFLKLQAQCNTLVWADEFNGTIVDATKWQSISGNGCPSLCGFGNAEAQRYDPNQATIVKEGTNSYLNIQAKYEPNAAFPQQPYSSAKLTTEGKYALKYGRVEARMKLSSGMGAWPAFWMLPAGVSNWPFTGEIDIMEAKHRNPKSVDGTIHYDGGGYHYTGRSYTSPTDLSTEFHVYAVEWGPNSIKWFIDGNLFHTATPSTTVNGGWPFNDQQFYIILNLAVGSLGTPYTSVNGAGVEPIPGDFPAKLQVDYVRVYDGSFANGVIGDAKVYHNETGKTYTLKAIAGASYNWTVPSGATITSGQGTNTITVNWGTTGGDVSAVATVSGCTATTYKLAVTTEVPLSVEKVHEDFQSNRNVLYPLKTGVLTEAVANPSATGVNTSALVGKYVRNASELYDVLNIKNVTISNANDYVYGRKKLSFDIYTSAPVGTKISMQLENSLVTTAINYPSGRHSGYKATTTVQNKWETIEFEFEKVIDPNTSALSINNVVFLFESNSNSGATYYFDNLLTKAAPEKPVIATDVLQNYDGINKIIKGTTTGTYSVVANPGTNSVNASANVARYVRNVTEQYDVLFFNTQSSIEDAGLLKNQTNKIMIDVYTSAPIGTVVSLNLENSATSLPANFPTGRNSNYVAITTKQNQWETLTFYYNSSPDAGTSNLAVNQMVLLFNSGSYTSDTYYFDNIRIGATKLPDTFTPGVVYEDYQTIRNITFRDAIGTYTANAANPSASGINTSANVGRYVRKATELYDNFSFNTTITNVGDFKSGTKKFAMDVYTSAPVGSVISWQAESSASIPSNFPVGRHSVYQGVVKQTNTWHTVTFTYASSPDASTLDSEVNRFVFLFEPGTSSGNTYYFDNIRSINLVTTENPTNTLPSPWVSTDLGAVTPAGVAAYSGGTFTVKGSGTDIWESSDQFQYVNQSITGDAEIIAKVNSLTNTNTYAKAGVMFRETLTPTSKHAMTNITAAAGVEFLSRDAVSVPTIGQGAAGTTPKWLRIVRSGNVFTSYSSDNGTTWTQIDTPRTIAMANTIYAGLAVTSHANGTLATGVFSDVTVRNITPPTNNVNLALAKTATASTEENATLSASKATDGDAAASRWASSFANASEWIYVDLQSTYNINRVVLKWEAAFATQYKVQISTDNVFTENETVNTQTASDGGTDDLVVSGTGRYIRILCTAKALAPYGYSLFEIEAYGTASAAKQALASKEAAPETAADLTIYPNPASDYIELSVSGNLKNKEVTIHDLAGNLVVKSKINTTADQSIIDISRLPKGIYILNFSSDEKSWTKKLIKK